MSKLIILFIFISNLYAEGTWEENIPSATNYDWVQTTSGEWLKGEFLGMYDEELTFDSDEFGKQTIDWDDVKRLISKSTTSLNIGDRRTVTGQLYVYDGHIYLHSQTETIELTRDDIVSMTNGGDTESSYWSGDFSLGITISGGNTEKKEVTSKLHIKRQTSSTRFLLDNLGNYTETFGTQTENNERLTSSFDIFQTRHFFWRPAFLEYRSDTFQNIKAKYTVGFGLGYDIISSPKTTWTMFIGPAYQSTTYVNVISEEDRIVTTPALVYVSNYDYEVTKDIDLILKYQAYFVNENSGKYVHNAIFTLKTELFHDFKLDYSFIWDRTQNPKQEETGEIPLQDDYKSVLSIEYSF